jgi:hypothetical protein
LKGFNMEEQLLGRIAGALEKLATVASALERLATVQEATEARVAARYAKTENDGREDEAQALVKANPTLSVENVVALLGSKGITRGKAWGRQTKIALGLPVGRRPQVAHVPKPANHRGLKLRSADYIDKYPDESKLSAPEIQALEAFAIEVIWQNPKASTRDLWGYIRDHRNCGLHRPEVWINSHRPA